MRGGPLAVFVATLGLPVGAQAATVLCKKGTKLLVRERACRSSERQMNLAAFGVVGPQGPTGPSGATGPPGATGTVGPTGAQGPTGHTGLMGSAGPAGPAGAAGAQGPTGAEGSAGDPGPTGPPGVTGAAGPAGPRGATGAGAVGAALAYGRVDGTVAVDEDGLRPGAVGVTSVIRLPDTTFVTRYQLSFAAGVFSATPVIVATPESAPDGLGEDNVCVVESPSPAQALVACSDLDADLTQQPQTTAFSFIAIGPP